ncbi:hypothetical protein GOODEAATRI_008067, partial [Goodea atripinnis]
PSDELAELALQGFDPVALDRSFSSHLHHCPYHLRLLMTQLMCGQELSECLHGQPLFCRVFCARSRRLHGPKQQQLYSAWRWLWHQQHCSKGLVNSCSLFSGDFWRDAIR